MSTIGKTEAIISLKPNASWSSVGDLVSWKDESQTEPSEAEIQAEIIRLQSVFDSQEYARNRATAFPSIGDQLDMLWHAIDTGDWTAAKVKTTDFYTKLKKVKDDNPKPS